MNKYMKMIGFALIGAIGGYAYYYFIGCNGGTCPITSNWYVTTLYGSMMGLVLGFPTNSKKPKNKIKGDDRNDDN
jgi:hypothetical protein